MQTNKGVGVVSDGAGGGCWGGAGAESGPAGQGWRPWSGVGGGWGSGKAEKWSKCSLVLPVDFINLCNLCPPLP